MAAEEGAAGVVAPAMWPLPLVGFRRRQLVFCSWNEMFMVHLNEKNHLNEMAFNGV